MAWSEATAGGERVTIRGYGPPREIYNYNNLAARLLGADLANLERAVQGHSLFQAGAGSSLSGLMKRFLASEVNVKIAEAPATVSPLLATGMLDAGYIERAQKAMGQAAPQMYGPLVLPPAFLGTF